MDNLSINWITEKTTDFEYKKYILLAYLQHVSASFEAVKLYPVLSELILHYRNLKELKENKNQLREGFDQKLLGADLTGFKLIYENLVNDDEVMREIENIVDFSIPQMEKHLKEGKKIYDFLESNITVSPVGITPLTANEGYIFLRCSNAKQTEVYNYQITLFENADGKYRGIYTHFIDRFELSITTTYESIKREVISSSKMLPNPATFAFETALEIPFDYSFLPLAKRMLVKMVA